MVGFMKSALKVFGLSKKGDEVQGSVDLEQFLTELPQHMGYDVTFNRIEKDEAGLHFEVDGSEADSFLGENCEMLDALAHLSMRVLRRSEGLSNAPASEGSENGLRVTFDAAGFRDKKAQELRDLAISQRQKVIDSGGKPSYIKALGPSERKIIHTTLAEMGEVLSESIGRGNFKRIRVRLKDDSQFRREPEARTESGGEGQELGATNGRSSGGGGGRGPRGGGGRSGGRGGRGRRGGGGGGRGGRGRSNGGGGGFPRRDGEVNGNVAMPDEVYDAPDDNIGNRLKPGEEPAFGFTNTNRFGEGADNN